MSRRTNIIAQLRTDFSTIAITSSIFKTMDEINDFPYITFTPSREQRIHIGGNQRIANMTITLRGYTYGDDVAPMEAAEALTWSIEALVDSFRSSHTQFISTNLTTQALQILLTQAGAALERQAGIYTNLGVISLYIASVRTDEGIMEPYSIVDMSIVCSYFVET